MAYNGSNAWYVSFGDGSTTGYFAVAQFAASHAYSAGQLIRQLTAPAVGSERVFVCIVAGTSGTEPTWTVTKGAKNTSTTPVFQECTGEPGVNGDISANCMQWSVSSTPPLGAIIYVPSNGSLQICSTSGAGGSGSIPAFSATAGATTADGSATWTSLGLASSFAAWAAPHARLNSAYATNWGAVGNDFYAADNSVEAVTGNITYNPPATSRTLSVDHTQVLPPTGASLKAGASVSATGRITFSGLGPPWSNSWYGFAFTTTFSTALNAGYALASGGQIYQRFENCSFAFTVVPGNNVLVQFGNAAPTNLDLVNCSFNFPSSAYQLNPNGAMVTWKATATPFPGVAPSTFLVPNGMSNMLVEGVDVSSLGSATLVSTSSSGGGYICLKDCKIAANAVTITPPSNNSLNLMVDLMRCDSGGAYRNERHSMQGDETTSSTVVRTGGASDGTTPVSHRIAPSSLTQKWSPFNALPLTIWNAVLGTNRQVSLYGISNAAALPTNTDFWFDVEYLGAAASPLGSFAFGGIANPLTAAAAWTADATSKWDSAAPARQNSSAYVVGNVIKLASNPGRVFFCTAIVSTGISAASEPGGYASAVDGGAVTDGNCTFRAGVRFSATLILSAPQIQQAGYLTVYPKFGTNVAAAIHIDPLIALG